jgi:hypothetical protein
MQLLALCSRRRVLLAFGSEPARWRSIPVASFTARTHERHVASTHRSRKQPEAPDGTCLRRHGAEPALEWFGPMAVAHKRKGMYGGANETLIAL